MLIVADAVSPARIVGVAPSRMAVHRAEFSDRGRRDVALCWSRTAEGDRGFADDECRQRVLRFVCSPLRGRLVADVGIHDDPLVARLGNILLDQLRRHLVHCRRRNHTYRDRRALARLLNGVDATSLRCRSRIEYGHRRPGRRDRGDRSSAVDRDKSGGRKMIRFARCAGRQQTIQPGREAGIEVKDSKSHAPPADGRTPSPWFRAEISCAALTRSASRTRAQHYARPGRSTVRACGALAGIGQGCRTAPR